MISYKRREKNMRKQRKGKPRTMIGAEDRKNKMNKNNNNGRDR